MKPAPSVTMPIPAISRPFGVILSPEGYQELGQQLQALKIKAFVDSGAPADFIQWHTSGLSYSFHVSNRKGQTHNP